MKLLVLETIGRGWLISESTLSVEVHSIFLGPLCVKGDG